MKKFVTAIATSLLLSHAAFAEMTIFYPNEKEAVFTVSAPDKGWEFTPSTDTDEDGGYCTLTKGDTVLYFRTVECSKEGIEAAIDETGAYVIEQYPGVEIPEPTEMKIQGADALACKASGKDKEGTECHFGFAWIFVDDKSVAEIWYESAKGDEANQTAATAILDSFKIVTSEKAE